MAYAKTTWVDYVTEANSVTMNNIENGLYIVDQTVGGKADAIHTHTTSDVTGFTEAVQDGVASLLTAGTGVTLAYDDAAGTLTISSSGGAGSTDPEIVRDTIAAALLGAGLITVTANDAGDTITIATTATANSTDAVLKARANHTGTQATSTITGLDAELAKIDAVLYYGTGTVPLRNTRTTDTTRPVRWRGSTQPPTTAGYALAIDIWESTT